MSESQVGCHGCSFSMENKCQSELLTVTPPDGSKQIEQLESWFALSL
jgi:hypothetical protein